MKIYSYIIYFIIIIVLLSHVLYLKFPNLIGFKDDGKVYYKLNYDLILIDPSSKKQVGFLKKNSILNNPSFSDVVDLGDTMTLKFLIDVNNNLIERVHGEPDYTEFYIK